MSQISDRLSASQQRITQLQTLLAPAESRIAQKACVYATGSFGRLEAGPNSDLDVFIVGLDDDSRDENGVHRSRLKSLDAICVEADLIHATRSLQIPEFDGDGRYLEHYSVQQFIKSLGTPQDDVANTFTGRLLLLLESTPLLGADVYSQVIAEVLTPYWRDFADHREEFIPAFLANDILRLWRTFCVNYEARTERVPDEKKKKGKLKNYKLKHSRLLTCYSALLYLLAVHNRNQTVTPDDVITMTRLTPTQRLEWLYEQEDCRSAHEAVKRLLNLYDSFLSTTENEQELAEKLMDRTEGRRYAESTYQFGDTVFEVLGLIGGGTRFHRLLVV
jgi:hypothetical protein